MNKLRVGMLFSVLGLAACSSKVVSYDATGSLIGTCIAKKGILSTAHASCTGSADAYGMNYQQIDPKTGLMPELPNSKKIHIP